MIEWTMRKFMHWERALWRNHVELYSQLSRALITMFFSLYPGHRHTGQRGSGGRHEGHDSNLDFHQLNFPPLLFRHSCSNRVHNVHEWCHVQLWELVRSFQDRNSRMRTFFRQGSCTCWCKCIGQCMTTFLAGLKSSYSFPLSILHSWLDPSCEQ